MTLSSAYQDFERKSDMSSKTTSKAPSAEKASRVELTWGYEVGMVQGKDVPSALNAPTNVLAVLMGKDF